MKEYSTCVCDDMSVYRVLIKPVARMTADSKYYAILFMQMLNCSNKRCSDVLRKNETVAVEPLWVAWVESHELVEQDVSDWGHAHGCTGVTRVGGEGRIDL